MIHHYSFRYKSTEFSFKTAPAALRRALDVVLAPLSWQREISNLNEVIVFSKDAQQYICQLEQVLELFRESKMTLKLKE